MTANSGYSGTPLAKKLGLKPGMGVRLLGEPDDYWDLLGGTAEALGVELLPSGGNRKAAFTHLFAADPDALEKAMARARAGMEEDGMVWASWPKKASGVPSTIGRAEVMAAGKAAGLVDVKVCAVDETWSGLKFMIRVADRREKGSR